MDFSTTKKLQKKTTIEGLELGISKTRNLKIKAKLRISKEKDI